MFNIFFISFTKKDVLYVYFTKYKCSIFRILNTSQTINTLENVSSKFYLNCSIFLARLILSEFEAFT